MTKPIVITGASGYIGSTLTAKLASQGYVLRLVSRSQGAPRIKSAHGAGVEYYAVDLRNPQSWSELLREANVVVHLSSRTDLRAAETNPVDDEDINLRPLRALVEAASVADTTPIIVFASAATIVGPNPAIPVDDTAPDDPCSVYDRHKLVGEMHSLRGDGPRCCSGVQSPAVECLRLWQRFR